jgi:heme-degrading monooxygenase HmoA
MYLRIIHGKLRPGTWSEFERAYKAAVADAGPIYGLQGRWLTRDVDDEDAGTTISLWSTEADLQAYEESPELREKITKQLQPFFSGDYTTSRSRLIFAEGEPAPSEWVGGDS